MAIYNKQVRKYAKQYFTQDEWFKGSHYDSLYDKSLRTWIKDSGYLGIQEVADSEIGRKSIRAFNYRLNSMGVKMDERVSHAVRLALMDCISTMFRSFNDVIMESKSQIIF